MNPHIYTGLRKSIASRFRRERHNFTIEDLIKKSTEYFGVTELHLKSADRNRDIMMPRHMIIYAIRTLFPDTTLKTIGSLFNRHHSTIISSIEVMNNMKETDSKFNEYLTRYMNQL